MKRFEMTALTGALGQMHMTEGWDTAANMSDIAMASGASASVIGENLGD